MAIRLTKENDHVQYGTTNFVADTDADITSLPTKVTPGSECFCIETSTTYILNNQGEWKVKSQGGGGGSSSYQEKTVTPDFSDGDVSVTADRRYKALSEVTIQKDSNLIAGNIKKDVTVHGITGSYEGESDTNPLKAYLERTVTTIDDDILEEIGSYTFSYYSGTISLESISFSKVTTIGSNAFQGCEKLTNVSFPEVTTISSNAFSNCKKLTSISFPKVTTIDGYAFIACTSLTSIIFPEVTSISNSNAFQGCAELTSANFPKAKFIGNSAFNNCRKLTSVNFLETTTIGPYAFQDCIGLTNINFPEATTISNYAFNRCTGLTNISFPKATSIGLISFQGCIGLTSINFPEATAIGGSAFYNCTGLTIADFNLINQFSNNVFYNCSSLTTLILRKNSMVTLANVNAFTNTPFVDEVTTATLYVPEALIPSYEANTYWAQILAHEGTTIQKIEGSPYENP